MSSSEEFGSTRRFRVNSLVVQLCGYFERKIRQILINRGLEVVANPTGSEVIRDGIAAILGDQAHSGDDLGRAVAVFERRGPAPARARVASLRSGRLHP